MIRSCTIKSLTNVDKFNVTDKVMAKELDLKRPSSSEPYIAKNGSDNEGTDSIRLEPYNSTRNVFGQDLSY